MKKILSLICCGLLFMAFSVNAQETLILSENFDNFSAGTGYSGSGPGALITNADSLMQIPNQGWTSYYLYPCMGSIKLGKSDLGGFVCTPALNLGMDGGTFVIRFKAMAWKGDNTSMKIVIINDNQKDTIEVHGLDNVTANGTSSNFLPFEVYCNKGTSSTKVKLMSYTDNKSRIFIDDLTISTVAGSVITYTPATITFNNVLPNESVTDNIKVTGYNLTEQSYQVSLSGAGFSTTVTSILKSDLENGYDMPITFAPTAPNVYTAILTIGNTHTTLIGNCIDLIEIATLAELREKAPATNLDSAIADNIFYKYTGKGLITSYGSNKYGYMSMTIQDETAAIMVYDQKGDFIGNLAKGQLITDLIGTLTNYYGIIELIPTKVITVDDPFADESQVVAKELTMAQLKDNDYMKDLQSQLVVVKSATITSNGTFEVNKKYVVNAGGTTDSILFTMYQDADFIGQAIPNWLSSLNGIVYFTYGKYVIIPRNMNDIVGIDEINAGFNVEVYPNPVVNELHFNGIDPTSVEIYSAAGTKVATYGNLKNVVPMGTLSSGTYFVRFVTDNGSAVKKIVK
ncbi:MAG: T9SS type A sorting domain-containing protein [Bacteroidales bacterium]|nr:T9SS type A sorting domain-containing protein [Bacteroidales bacterium]